MLFEKNQPTTRYSPPQYPPVVNRQGSKKNRANLASSKTLFRGWGEFLHLWGLDARWRNLTTLFKYTFFFWIGVPTGKCVGNFLIEEMINKKSSSQASKNDVDENNIFPCNVVLVVHDGLWCWSRSRSNCSVHFIPIHHDSHIILMIAAKAFSFTFFHHSYNIVYKVLEAQYGIRII